MKYKHYENLIESNVESFGKVPESWNKIRLRNTIEYVKNGVWGDEPDGENDIICIRVADFNRVSAKIDDKNLTLRKVDKIGDLLLQKGNLLIEKSGGGEKQLVGAVVEFDKDFSAVCSNFVAKVKVLPNYHSRYLTYIHSHLYSSKINYKSIKQTTGIQNLDSQHYFNNYIFIPLFNEQRSIAAFLDRETARIDALIEKKQKLIALLKEKRTALITRAVTKGLNTNAKMKDSGIEWLGKIPEHWEVKKLKYVASMKSGENITSNNIEPQGTYPVFGGNGKRGYCDSFTHKGEYVLIGRQGALCGNINYANGKFWASEHAVVVKPKTDLNTFWLGELLRAMDLNQYSLASAQPGLSVDRILYLQVPVPPVTEQDHISQYLNDKFLKMDKLSNLNIKAIEKLREYRTALISAAVTGKVRVG